MPLLISALAIATSGRGRKEGYVRVFDPDSPSNRKSLAFGVALTLWLASIPSVT